MHPIPVGWSYGNYLIEITNSYGVVKLICGEGISDGRNSG